AGGARPFHLRRQKFPADDAPTGGASSGTAPVRADPESQPFERATWFPDLKSYEASTEIVCRSVNRFSACRGFARQVYSVMRTCERTLKGGSPRLRTERSRSKLKRRVCPRPKGLFRDLALPQGQCW